MIIRVCFLILVALPWIAPAIAHAQDRSRFGVVSSLGLPSDFQDTFDILLTSAEGANLRSRDFDIGVIVRGRHLGGDWGVSFVQHDFEDGSTILASHEFCDEGGCQFLGHTQLQGVRLRGVLVHKFVPFATIKRRVQIGLNAAGGIGRASGTGERHQFDVVPTRTGFELRESVSQVQARELFLDGRDTLPLWKLEAMVTALIAPGLKVRVGTGLHFGNYPSVSIGASYLFGTD